MGYAIRVKNTDTHSDRYVFSHVTPVKHASFTTHCSSLTRVVDSKPQFTLVVLLQLVYMFYVVRGEVTKSRRLHGTCAQGNKAGLVIARTCAHSESTAATILICTHRQQKRHYTVSSIKQTV